MLLFITTFHIALLLPALTNAETSIDGVWNDVHVKSVTAIGSRAIAPQHFRLLSLDQVALKRTLDATPLEDTGFTGATFTLPLPDGKFAEFNVVESPIMEPKLAAKFPELKTYLGTGIDDPTASLRFSVTPQGLHAQILSATGTVYVDPYQTGDNRHHISYARKDYTKAATAEPFTCHVNDLLQPQLKLQQSLVPTKISSGTQRRTYRVAIAATGEYTAFHGGTVAAALNAIVVALNRVNGLYERDVAIRMILVGDNDRIIYTNANFDPYTNDDGDTMLDENQENLDVVIGTYNYDIGHVFSTGDGGIASLFSPCDSYRKAMGVTGSSAPIGDAFYVDYVAHEMGHQFGAKHTFNSQTESCGGNNRNSSTAYEPGSGTTIMAYAGICGTDNLQPHSDAHFHGISIQEIVQFSTGQVDWYNGDVCAVKAATGNTPPTVDAGLNSNPAYTIPKNTPFQLTGTASDVNDDALTYDWEEFDLGPAGIPNSPSENAPIFRAFLPTANQTRTFPKLADLLNNTQTIGELLPSYSRALNFRLTVRDNRAGGGGVNQDSIALQVSGYAGPFQVTAPNTAVTWAGMSTQTVTWNVAGTTAAPINCANVRFLLSTDGGNNFSTTILAGTPNDGSQAIVVPNIVTTKARIKVACTNNVFFDISNANFTIVAKTLQINDISLAESNAGRAFVFTVKLSAASTSIITVKYATANSTAIAPGDYTATTGTLTFSPGQISKTVTVNVKGDTVAEPNEKFLVNLSSVTGQATILDAQGVGTIINDDGPLLRINDVTKTEGNSGVIPFVLTATLTPASTNTVTVKYTTANNTAIAGTDYVSTTGTLTFSSGQTSKPIIVSVLGDTVFEANEKFLVNLSSVTGSATLFDGQGAGTISNDD